MDELSAKVGLLLSQRGLTLALAESCTGGLIAHHVTNVPGSSAYFLGGVVSYANSIKEEILGVPPATLEERGAVSEETASAMARGARELFRSDIAVSVTGIAGPTGGTESKPVGLVYIALDAAGFHTCEEHIWPGASRIDTKRRSAQASLQLLVRYLTGD
jgi:nicotinamide-nucleotide amidase